nr:zinc finger, CCHC-type [Tanacetum cinerariifolium]
MVSDHPVMGEVNSVLDARFNGLEYRCLFHSLISDRLHFVTNACKRKGCEDFLSRRGENHSAGYNDFYQQGEGFQHYVYVLALTCFSAHDVKKSELYTGFSKQNRSFFRLREIFHSCRQEEGQSVSSYVLKMKGYIDNLERLGHPVTLGLGVSLILIGLRKEYDGFVQNYNMHNMGKTVNELHAMLKLHEQTLPKSNTPALYAIRAGKVQKRNKHKKSHSQKGAKGQNQGKGKFVPNPKILPPPKRENPTKDSICHECREIGHWKRNCPQYLAELMKKKKNTASGAGGSGIFVIKLNTILNRSWIYDTGCGTHICNTTHGLRASRKLKQEALRLYVDNGQREAVEAIGAFYLWIDYEETFSPVADIRAIRILIAIVAYYDNEIWQMDDKTAFLKGYLNEEVYMEQPEGFVNPKYPNRVCKLKHSIYGLKQASRQWNKRFENEIKNIPMLQSVKTYLGKCFAMKDLGEAAYILGIKIYRDRSKRLIGLCQSAYIEKILKRDCMENSKRGSIPMQEKLKLSKSQGASAPAEMKRMQNVLYASAVGSIMYAVRCTRPDVAFAQNITSRFQ